MKKSIIGACLLLGVSHAQEQDLREELAQLSQMLGQMAAMTGSDEIAAQAGELQRISSVLYDQSRYNKGLDAALTMPEGLSENLWPIYENVQKLCHEAAGALSSGVKEYNAHHRIQATEDEEVVRPVSNAFLTMLQGIMTLDYVVGVRSGKMNPGEKCDVLGNSKLILKASNAEDSDPANLSFKEFFNSHPGTVNALMATSLMHGLFAEVLPAFNAAYTVSHGTFQKLAELSAKAKVAQARVQRGTRGRVNLNTRGIEADAAKGRHDIEMIEKFKASADEAMSRLSVLYYEVNPDKKPTAPQPGKNAQKNAKRKAKKHADRVAAAAAAAERARLAEQQRQEERERQLAETADRAPITAVQNLSHLDGNGLPTQYEAGSTGPKPVNK